jgi:hypothetical protein
MSREQATREQVLGGSVEPTVHAHTTQLMRAANSVRHVGVYLTQRLPLLLHFDTFTDQPSVRAMLYRLVHTADEVCIWLRLYANRTEMYNICENHRRAHGQFANMFGDR